MARPDVIAIQETHAEDRPTLPGYRAHACPPSTRTCGKGAAQGVSPTTSKGRDLLEDATEAEFTLLTNPAHPSRIGTSAARDTNPDLAFAMLPDGGTARWKNTGINLGSDHFIIEIELPLAHLNGNPNRSKSTTHKLVDWSKFRNTELGNIDNIDDWRSLQKRWRRQRHKRKLRKKIAELGREIERYSRQLCSQQWFALCRQADGQLHRGGTWKLLRQLMDETKSCEYQRTRMAQILHTTARQLGEEEMYKRLNERYLPITTKIDAAIRKAYTGALGLLPGTKTTALLSLGAHNTLSEISEAQRASQLSRLSSTAAGRRLLDRVGLLPPGERVGTGPYGELEEQVPLSDETARKVIVYPLPKNTDPERDEGRRAARAVALARQHQRDESAVYVDAARYPRRRNAFAAVVVRATTGELLTASTVRARTAGQAEEVAIALAMGLPGTRTVLSDSKSAIKNFARGTVWQGTERLVRSIEATRTARGAAAGPTIALKWFPAHMGRQLAPDIKNRNEEADAAARGFITCRTAAVRPSETSGEDRKEDFEPLTDYGVILAVYREVRRAFPPPHRELPRAEAVKFRQLQTECVLTPALAPRHVRGRKVQCVRT
ncbi:hypothetical protein HPB50_020755 [Hyalomma asiaticum]|uniref:Uncharacterized protein n=1 Tax=Hyalomma asiaticum TaxID=266040 RepID=A0ACB7RMX7_HYAAI|nr:hypothetical protein HPB50_020755 [Hyalomma asiaticum]